MCTMDRMTSIGPSWGDPSKASPQERPPSWIMPISNTLPNTVSTGRVLLLDDRLTNRRS